MEEETKEETNGEKTREEEELKNDLERQIEEDFTADVPEDVDVDWLVDKILLYCEKQADVDLYPYQKDFGKRLIESLVLNDGETITALFSRQCIPKGDMVHTREGEIKRIEECENSFKTGDSREVFEIRGKGGYTVRATEFHPIMTPTGWKNVGDIKKGDKIAVLDEWDNFGDGIVDYRFERYVNMHKNEIIEGQYEINEELAELVGWLTADGYIAEGQSIKFTNINREYLERVEYLVENNFGDIEVKWYEKGNGYDLLMTTGENSRFNSLRRFIKAMDYDEDGFPKKVNDFTREQAIAYFKGMFAADGYVYEREEKKDIEIGLSCGNEYSYADFHRELLNKLGVYGRIKREHMKKNKDGSKFNKVVITGQRNVERFREMIVIPGKPIPELDYSRMNNVDTFEDIDGEKLKYVHVIGKRGIGEREVWDLEVPVKKWFVSGGVKVHNSGKTETVAVVLGGIGVILPILAKMPQFEDMLEQYRDGVLIGLFAPSNDQVHTLFSRLRDRIKSKNAKMFLNDPEIDTKIIRDGRGVLKLDNGTLIRMQSAAKQSQIESKTYHITVIDECQDVGKQKLRKSISPMLASTNGTMVQIGTPIGQKCVFYENIQRNKRRDAHTRGGNKHHFRNDYKTVQKYNPRYKQYVKKEKQKMGEDSDEFRMSYKIEWILERGMFLTSTMKEEMLDKSHKHQHASEKYCAAGVDVGKKNDSTVVTVLEVDWDNIVEDKMTKEIKPAKRLLHWLELKGDDYESQYHEVLDFLGNYNIKCIYVDSTGVGTPIADRLKWGFEGQADIVPYDFTIPSKSDMWKNLQTELRRGRLIVPNHAKTRRLRPYKRFIQQMEDLIKDYKRQHLVCQHPEGDKYAHDDYPDSLGLACMAAHHDAMPEINATDNVFFEDMNRRVMQKAITKR